MKKISLFCSILLSAQIASAQNPNYHLTDRTITNMDFDANTNRYVLIGTTATNPLAGYANVNPHISLNIFDNITNNTVISTTYITNEEVNLILQHECNTLGALFRPNDVKKTSDGGYIICGNVMKTSEVSQCSAGSTYNNPFLLKTDAAGNVVWYKRYSGQNGQLQGFTSVIENERRNGYLVCGTESGNGFVMSVDPLGSLQWSHIIKAYQYNRPGYQITSAYTRICRYTDPNTRQVYYVLTGHAGQENNNAHVLSYGGGLLTVLDANGAVYNNVQISSDNNVQFMQFYGVADAFDGDVVLTGTTAASIGGGTCTIGTGWDGSTVTAPYDTYDITNYKLNPLTMTPSFLKVYETNLTDSRGINVTTYASGGNISVIGQVSGNEGEYLETDVNGNLVRFTEEGGTYTSYGSAITYNTINGYAVYGGTYYASSVSDGYLIKNKYYKDQCGTDGTPPVTQPDPVIVPNEIQDEYVNEIIDFITSYSITPSQNLVCGSAKKQSPSTIANMAKTDKLAVYPNPTGDVINIKLPNDLKSGNIEIYDIIGGIVYSGKFSNVDEINNVDVAGLSAGAYSVVIKNGHAKYTQIFNKY